MFAPEKITETCFPDENYKLEDLGENYHRIAAYVDGECARFALTKMEWNMWLYLDNLLVLKKFRRAGVGTALIESSMELAKSMGLLGVWLVCQDNNLQAMKFYFRNGFTLGGMNMPVYEGTKQEGKADLYLYRRVKSLERMPQRFPFFKEAYIPTNKYHKMFVAKWYLVLYQIQDDTVYVDYILLKIYKSYKRGKRNEFHVVKQDEFMVVDGEHEAMKS